MRLKRTDLHNIKTYKILPFLCSKLLLFSFTCEIFVEVLIHGSLKWLMKYKVGGLVNGDSEL